MIGKGRTRNEIYGGIFFSAVVQGRDITVVLPPQVHPALAGIPDESKVFTGRDTDLKQLMELLGPANPDTAAVRVSAVGGLGGVGKTELVLHAARAALRNGWFPGGVLFVDMFGYDPQRRVEAGIALEGMLRAAGISGEHIPAEVQDRSRLFSSVMAAYANEGRPVLVVIDNVSSSEQARPLLPAGGSALVTSRHTLADLDARLLELDTLTEQAGVELLAGQLRLARGAADTRVADHPDHALSIARRCAGLPLALRIVAALLATDPARPLESIAADLHEARDRLDEIRYTGTGGEVAVRSAFDLSYYRLDPQQARMFRLLTVNTGPEISTEAASAMTALDQRTIRRHLEELRRAHLIETGTTYGRWRMHDLIRLYAQGLSDEHAAADGQYQALDRLLGYYLGMTNVADDHLRALPGIPVPTVFNGRPDALEWLDAERPNLVAAVRVAAATGRDGVAIGLPLVLTEYFVWRRHLDDWLATAAICLAAAKRLADGTNEGKALNNLGMVLRGVGRLKEAVTAFQRAAAISQATGDRRGEAAALNNLALALQEVGRFEEAVSALQAVLMICRKTGDRRGEGMALSNLGVALTEAGQVGEAIDAHQGATVIFRKIGDRYGEGVALSGLGSALHKVGRFGEAIEAHQAGLAICKETGDRNGEGIALSNLGLALKEVGRFGEAIGAYQGAAAICQENDDPPNEGMALYSLGQLLLEIGRFAQAIKPCREAAVIFRETGDQHREGAALYSLGNALQGLGVFEDAITAHQAAAAIFRETGDRHGEGLALKNLGLDLLQFGQFEKAIVACRAAAAAFREIGDRRLEGVALNDLGLALLGDGRSEEAISVHQAAAAIFRETGDRRGEGMAQNNLGLALQDIGRFEEATDAYREDIAICREIGDRHGEGTTLNTLGIALQKTGRFDEAIAAFQSAAAIFRETNDSGGENEALNNIEQARILQQP